MTLNDLERVAPALLSHRSETPRPIAWALLHNLLGITFPADYIEYFSHYPPLLIDGFMTVLGPTPGREDGYVAAISEKLEMMRSLADDDMTEDYKFHPEADGLFPWGASNEGDMFFWRMNGRNPDDWSSVVYTSNGDWWEHSGGTLSLLVGLIDGSVEHRGLPPQPGRNPTVT